tara:strand:- start:306 stop:1367 length:1062 start_codon:yes stop_codon:yes gene_type:complete
MDNTKMNSEDTNMLVARQTPTGRGMTFVRFEMIKLDDIDVGIGRNTGRGGKGMVSPKIEDFIRIMLNGNYSPEYYIPPVVECSAINEFTISLKAGFHRVIGGKRIWEQVKNGQREEDPNIPATMGMIEVAVVDFDDDVARELYANLENLENENHVKTDRSDLDIAISYIAIRKNFIADGDWNGLPAPKNSAESEAFALSFIKKDMKVPSDDRCNRIYNLVLVEGGVTSKVVHVPERSELKVEAEKLGLNNPIYTATFRTKDDPKYDYGVCKAVMDNCLELDGQKTSCFARYTSATATQISTYRPIKEDVIRSKLKELAKFGEFVSENNIDTDDLIDFRWASQLCGEQNWVNVS